MRENISKKIKIIKIQAADIIIAQNLNDETRHNISIRNQKGQIINTHFKGYLDNSLELIKLEEVYRKHKDDFNEKFIFKLNGVDATTAIVNVEFTKRVYNFNMYTRKTGRVYVKIGYDITDVELEDHVCVRKVYDDEELLAIEIPYYQDYDKNELKLKNYEKVKNPIRSELLGEHFSYNQELGCYIFEQDLVDSQFDIFNVVDRNPILLYGQPDVREEIYQNGFDIDGVHYIRYKRSAGSAREGNCLFIAESLYDDMMEWTNCEIDKEQVEDVASWEAYSALTLSSIESIVPIPKASILFMHDKSSIFIDKIINIKDVTGADGKNSIVKEEGSGAVQNEIWDGEALLDSSVFNNNGYKNCGMLLLRNKFFKSCAFNTNIQKWFQDNNITQISQLNGYTTARKISEIKMIVTDSSLKYLKLKGLPNGDEKEYEEAINTWLKNIEKYFGVVKTEKNTGYLDGNLVSTTYQIINTLDLDIDDVKALVFSTFEYMENIKDSSMYMRHYLKYKLELDKLEDYVEEGKDINREGFSDISILSYYNRVIMEMISLNDDFAKTRIYRNFLYKVTDAIKNNIKHGRILIKGNYSTLFGNGAELLKASIDKNYEVEDSVIEGSNIYTKRFANGAELFCARSPHITMGNLMLATNQYSDFYDKYFNLSDEIVCVNAINNNIQQRLNGCDYDSDTMLITNNEIMINAARKHYAEFLVPTCSVSTKAKKYKKGLKGLAMLDKNIAKNSIGRIVNLSQILNSIYWDNLKVADSEIDIKEVYRDICELAVESGMEIDKAKREYDVNPSASCSALIKKYKLKEKEEYPLFFNYLKIKGPKVKQRKQLKKLTGVTMDTAMQYMYEAGYDGFISRSDLGMEDRKNQSTVPILSLIKEVDFEVGQNDYKYKGEILNIAKQTQEELDAIRSNKKYKDDNEKIYLNEQEAQIIDNCFKDIESKIKNEHIIYLLLKEIDKEDRTSGYTAILFSALCLDSKSRLYNMVIQNRDDIMYELEPSKVATKDSTLIYGIPHDKIAKRFKKSKDGFSLI